MESKINNKLIKDLLSIKINKTVKGSTQKSSNKQTKAVINILETHKFIRTNLIGKRIPELEKGMYYIEQPYGTQKFPDFLLIHSNGTENRIINFELKKGDNNRICWNDGFPQENSLYLYTDTSGYNILFTYDSISEEDKESFILMCKYIEKIKIKLKDKKTDFNFFPRKAITQKVGKNKNDLYNSKILLNKFTDDF